VNIYNEIKKLDRLKPLVKLEKLYFENNLIVINDELNHLTELTEIKDVISKGNLFILFNSTLYNSNRNLS
jgi:hypothetical protein